MRRFFENRNALIVFSICYLIALIYLLFFAFFRDGTTTAVNLMPFANIGPLTIYTFKTGHGILHWIINVPGNIIAFIPLPVIFQLFRKIRFSFLLLFTIPFFIELAQYFFKIGSCDVDDVLLNFVGILIGILIIKKIQKAD